MSTEKPSDHPNVIGFPPLIFAIGAVASAALGLLVPLRITAKIPCWPVGLVLSAVAGLLATSAARAMRKRGTNIVPSEPTLAIVVNGPFRLTRNPMYLSLCLLQCSLGLFMNNWIPVVFTAILGAVLHFGVVLREEHYLEAKFGENYLTLKRNVRRWI